MNQLIKKIYRFVKAKANPTKNLDATLITFKGVEGKDVYNVSGPFSINNVEYIAGRVETRDKQDSLTMFFQKVAEHEWQLIPDSPAFDLEDPFQTIIDGDIILGGVRIKKNESGTITSYQTIFYKGKTINALREFAVGPLGMKDIRLMQIVPPIGKNPGNIIVFTRPQGEYGGLGKIAVTFIETLDQLTEEHILQARIIPELFTENEWGGVNDLYKLRNGMIGVLYHIAHRDDAGNRHYRAAVFIYDPLSGRVYNNQVIATREQFPDSPIKIIADSKKPDDLKNVVFPSRLVIQESRAILYSGLSDTTTGILNCPNPFIHLPPTTEK